MPEKQQNIVKIQRRIPTQARARAKYRAVLDACTQVLSEHGYQRATVMELSLVSGVAVPTIYQYFSNKEEIFTVWLEDAIDTMLAQVSSRGASGEVPATVLVENILNATLPAVDAFSSSIRRLFTDLPHMLQSHALQMIRDKTATVVESEVAVLFGGELPADMQLRLQILMQCVLGYLFQHVLIGERSKLDTTISHELAQLVVSYLGTTATQLHNSPMTTTQA